MMRSDSSFAWAIEQYRRTQSARRWRLPGILGGLLIIGCFALVALGVPARPVEAALVFGALTLLIVAGIARAVLHKPIVELRPPGRASQTLDSGAEELGGDDPESMAVSAFLHRVGELNAEQWRQIARRFEGGAWSFWQERRLNRVERAWAFVLEIVSGEEQGRRAGVVISMIEALVARGRIPFDPPHSEFWATRQASMAVLFKSMLPQSAVLALYEPFDSTIPLADSRQNRSDVEPDHGG
jgi:hypothetical protein